MLRKIRLVLAVLCFAVITGLFLDATGTIQMWMVWMVKIQFLPAVLALNVGVIVFLMALTLVFGRIYCSVICPLGVFQDIVSWISSRRKNKKYRFYYSPEVKWVRYGVLLLFLIALIAGIGAFVAVLAPYGSYGRMVSNLFAPVFPAFIIAAVSFVVLVVLAWRNGRTYCNTICPVGTFLSFISRYALFRLVIDVDKCKNCSLCSRKCKTSCIDYKNHKIDYSRCVACMDCIDVCKHGALSYGYRLKKENGKQTMSQQIVSVSKTNEARRHFLSTLAFLGIATTLKAEGKKEKSGLAKVEDKVNYKRVTPIIPPGSLSANNFSKHCVACQLCVSACLNHVLSPSTDLASLLQPEMSYERGYCDPECTRCSDVCPAGAIRPITVEKKSATRIGHAEWVRKNCITQTDSEECGVCARHCPSGAIEMAFADFGKGNVRVPSVNASRCIGCGACENSCPAQPFKAIYVEGHEVHSTM